MSESEQEQRKLRTVVCDAHGLRYDPDVQEGCVRCLKEMQGPEGSPSDGFDKRIPIALGAVVLLALFLLLGGDQEPPSVAGLDEETAAKTETAVQVEAEPKGLDPSPFGLQIKKIEDMLFSEDQGWIFGNDLYLAVSELSASVAQADSSQAMEASRQIEAYAKKVQIVEDVGYSGVNVEAARNGWEEVRDLVFVSSRSFSKAAGSELRQDKELAVRELAEDLEDALDDVENFIGDNEWDVMQIAEVGEVVTPEDKIVVAHWTDFVREWNDELNDAVRDYPTQPPVDLNFNLTMAYQELGNAVSELRSLTVSGGSLPTAPLWAREANVQKARSHVDAAREYLEKIYQ